MCSSSWPQIFSLCNPHWPQTQDLPALASQVLGFLVCMMTPSLKWKVKDDAECLLPWHTH